MKKTTHYFVLILLSLFIVSCEDKVDIPLETDNPKLVIDAAIKWQKGTSGNEQKIKLTTTTNYYSNTIPVVSGATVFITNSSNVIFNFIETPNTGVYVCTNFIPILNENYTLTVIVNGQIYKASEKLLETPKIDSVTQFLVPGFGSDQIQVKFYYQDNPLENNFYLIGVKNSAKFAPEFGVNSDEFFQGNQMFGFYGYKDLEAGNKLDLSLQGISERYSNYMTKLLSIADTNSSNPFSTPPATLRGNIVKQSNLENYPLGYFSLGEIDTKIYTVQ